MPGNFDNFLKEIWDTTKPSNVRSSTSLNESYFYQNSTSKLLALILAKVNASIQGSIAPPNTTFSPSITKNQSSFDQISSGSYENVKEMSTFNKKAKDVLQNSGKDKKSVKF
ncbi:unnamed protein product [Brachionus calyciflorus]|uniref:Uncharacterized protein n=1 Tax=Brachionus calyciflorus TaxID=104777 RepID=A0A814CBN8_9BILA|nr:unnamed protein product [Brachionus calyciflorus]